MTSATEPVITTAPLTTTNNPGVMSDHTGKTSMMRVMSFIALLASIGFGYLTVKLNSDPGVYITTTFLLAAFVPKALQKFVENAYPTKPQ